MMGEVGLEIRKGCLRHLDDCEISARFYGLKSWRLPTHLRTSTLQITLQKKHFTNYNICDSCIPVCITQSFKVGN